MKIYKSSVKSQETLETKRVPFNDHTNIICTRNRNNKSKIDDKNYLSYQCNVKTRIFGTRNDIEKKQVLDDINCRKCQVFLDRDKSIENQIIKTIGSSNKRLNLSNANKVTGGSIHNRDNKVEIFSKKSIVVLNKDKLIEIKVMEMFGDKITPYKNCYKNIRRSVNANKSFSNKSIGNKIGGVHNRDSKVSNESFVLLNKDKLVEKKIIEFFGDKATEKNRFDTSDTNKNSRQTNSLGYSKMGQKDDVKKNVTDSKNIKNPNIVEAPHRNLRKRNSKQNFAEKSLNESNDEPKLIENNKDKRPIYRRTSQLKESQIKKSDDVYAFDMSFENGSRSPSKRKKKRGQSSNVSLPFERYMKEIVKTLDEKHDKEKGKNTKRNVKKVKIQNKIPRKVNKNEKKVKNVGNKNKPTEVIISNLSNNAKESTKTNQINIISNVNIVPSISKKVENQKQFTSTPLHPRHSSPDIFDSENNEEYVPITDFDLLNKTPNVNRFQELNSGMSPIVNKTITETSIEASPWRFNIEVRRNPHFLQYKRSLLPNYNQEMVLDSTLIEKQSFNNKSMNNSNVNVPVQKQTSILKYISGGKNVENLDSINIHQSSLFDGHEFTSPQKRKSFDNKENKVAQVKRNILDNLENNSSTFEENVNFVTKRYPKRNILGPKIDNENNIKHIGEEAENFNESSTNSSSSQSKSDFFGFDTSEINHQLESNQNTPRRMEDIIKKLVKVQKNVDFVDNETTQDKVCPEINEDAEKELEEIGFFDYQDKEPERNLELDTIKQYKRGRAKRRRSLTPSATESEDDEEPTRRRRKKKNQRTKAEEAAAEKWYSEFNKMCEEVDKFPLEIEKVK